MTAADILRISDQSDRADLVEIHEARARRLMAERSRIPLRWDTRAERRRLFDEANDAIDEYLLNK